MSVMLHGRKQVRVPAVRCHLDKTGTLTETKSLPKDLVGSGFGVGFLSLLCLGTVTLLDGRIWKNLLNESDF